MKQFRIRLKRAQDLIVVFVPERATDFSLFPPGNKFKFWTLVYCLLEGTDYYDAEIIEEKINDVNNKEELLLLGSWHHLFNDLVPRKKIKDILESSCINLRSWHKKPEFPKTLHNRKKIKEYREQEKRWLELQDDVVLILVNKEYDDDDDDDDDHRHKHDKRHDSHDRHDENRNKGRDKKINKKHGNDKK